MSVPATAPPTTPVGPTPGHPAAVTGTGVAGADHRRAATPTRMRWLQVVCFLVAVVVGGVLAADALSRLGQLGGARRASELVVSTQELRSSLGQADGAAVGAFLAGGIDEPEQRTRYLEATDAAAVALIRAGRAAEGDEAVAAVDGLQEQLPVYTGLIETARADNRQELPLGAAYLRTASDLVRTDIDDQIATLRQQGDQAYRDDADGLLSGLGWSALVAAGVALVVLVAAQVWLYRRTNRLLNTGLVGATLLLAGGLVVLNAASQRSALSALDGTEAYDELRALSAIRADAYDQQAASTFALVDRGARDDFNARAATAAQNVDARLADLGADSVTETAWADYLSVSDQVTALDDDGDYDAARELAFDKPEQFSRFDQLLTERTLATTEELDARLDDVRLPLGAIQFAGIPLGLAVGALAAAGFQQRLNDYR